MIREPVENQRINTRKLWNELRAAGITEVAIAFPDDGTVRVVSDSPPEVVAAVAQVVAAHDPTPDAAEERREERREALVALVGVDAADAALDGFLRAIKARPGLPREVAAYIKKHGL